MANLIKCCICGAEYAYCPNCANTHAWKFYTDTHEHYQVFMILQQYSVTKDKEEARIALGNIGITEKSDLDIFKPKIAEKIRAIFEDSEQKLGKTEKRVTRKASMKSKLFE